MQTISCLNDDSKIPLMILRRTHPCFRHADPPSRELIPPVTFTSMDAKKRSFHTAWDSNPYPFPAGTYSCFEHRYNRLSNTRGEIDENTGLWHNTGKKCLAAMLGAPCYPPQWIGCRYNPVKNVGGHCRCKAALRARCAREAGDRAREEEDRIRSEQGVRSGPAYILKR